jgi:amino acid transporter
VSNADKHLSIVFAEVRSLNRRYRWMSSSVWTSTVGVAAFITGHEVGFELLSVLGAYALVVGVTVNLVSFAAHRYTLATAKSRHKRWHEVHGYFNDDDEEEEDA